jgi:plasmid stabilization system protein ParE
MEVLRASSFWRDLRDAIDYFDDVHAEDAGLRFLEALDKTIDFIAEFPDLGNPWESAESRFQGMRFRLVTGFEGYLVVYRTRDEHVYLLRLLHGSQNILDI